VPVGNNLPLPLLLSLGQERASFSRTPASFPRSARERNILPLCGEWSWRYAWGFVSKLLLFSLQTCFETKHSCQKQLVSQEFRRFGDLGSRILAKSGYDVSLYSMVLGRDAERRGHYVPTQSVGTRLAF